MGEQHTIFNSYPNRLTRLGDLSVHRALPIRELRLVGPWCFLDRFGPLTFSGGQPMQVPPHPHIGLQTVSWLLEGEVLHNDSLGCQAQVKPGGVNVMTSGCGIAHSEETPPENSGRLNGVQLWVALPENVRNLPPAFINVPQVPVVKTSRGVIQVFAGEYAGETCPVTYFSEIIGLDVHVSPGAALPLEMKPGFEYAFLLLEGDCRPENEDLQPNRLDHLGLSRSHLSITSQAGCRLLIIGGSPFPDKILMWWNFVARTKEEIASARADWEAGCRFGRFPVNNQAGFRRRIWFALHRPILPVRKSGSTNHIVDHLAEGG